MTVIIPNMHLLMREMFMCPNPNTHHLFTECSHSFSITLLLLLTNEQLAVELQMNESVSGSFLCRSGEIVDLQRRFLHVPLGSHAVPAVVVQREARLHSHLQRPVPHIEREDDLRGSCSGEQTETDKRQSLRSTCVTE